MVQSPTSFIPYFYVHAAPARAVVTEYVDKVERVACTLNACVIVPPSNLYAARWGGFDIISRLDLISITL